MSNLPLRDNGIRIGAFLLFLTVATNCCLAAQATTAPPKSDESSVPIPQQPADDESPELKNPVKQSSAKEIEARAAYMEGLAAQKDGNTADAIKAFIRAAEADPTAPEPVRAHALLLRRLGRARQAEEMARKAIKLDPDDYQMRLELAGMLLSRRNAADASSLIDSALASKKLDKKSPDFINLHSVRGRIYLLTRDAAKAAESFGVILEALEKPENFGLNFRQHQTLISDRTTGYKPVGQIMLQTGNYDKAITAFSGLIRVNENAPSDDHYWLALAQYRKDDLAKAEENLNRYFESNRRSRPALQLLSDIYRANSKSDEIVKRLGELSADTNEADAVNLFLGDMLVDKGDAEAAIKVYNNVIANSGNADAYIGLIKVDVLNHDATSFMASVTKALKARIQRQELVPLIDTIVNSEDFAKKLVSAAVESIENASREQSPDAIYFYSQIADRLNLIEPEGKLLLAALDENPDPALTTEALGRLGLNQYMQDDSLAAAETFKRMLDIPGLPAGERVMTLYRLSAAEADNGNFDTAILAAETALKLAPQNAQLTYQLGYVQLLGDKHSDAEKSLNRAVKLAEADSNLESQSRILLGSLYSEQNRWDEAIAAYKELLAMPEITQRNTRRGRMALSNAYVQSGDIVNGEKILEEVYKLEPDDPGVNNDLGYLYAEQNKNLEKAEQMIRIAVEAEPENPAYLDSLGWVLYRLGKHEEAAEALKKANADPDYRDSTIIEHLGDVQKALSKLDDARKAWQEALDVENKSVKPDDTVVKRLTEKLKSDGGTPEN